MLLMMGCIFFVSSLIYASGTKVTINIIDNPNLTGQRDKDTSRTVSEIETNGIDTGIIATLGEHKGTKIITEDKVKHNKTTYTNSSDYYPIIGTAKRIFKELKVRIEAEEKNFIVQSESGSIIKMVISGNSGFTENNIEQTTSFFSKFGSFLRRSLLSYKYSFFETVLSAIKGYPLNILSLTVFKTAAFTSISRFK